MMLSTAEKAQKYIELKRKLIEWTKAETVARHAPFSTKDSRFIACAATKLDIEDEIRVMLFGTSDLVELGEKWGLLKEKCQWCGKYHDDSKNCKNSKTDLRKMK